MNKEKLIKFVQNTLPVSIEKANQLVKSFQGKEILKNDLILSESEVCNESYFLQEGFMRAYTYDPEGNELTTAFYSKNMFAMDYVSFFKRVSSKENIQALSNCQTWFITYEDLQVNYHAVPEFREFWRLLLVNNTAALKQKVFSLLHESAEQRYANLIKSNPAIFQQASLKRIASYLGITDTSLSRIRKEFIKK